MGGADDVNRLSGLLEFTKNR